MIVICFTDFIGFASFRSCRDEFTADGKYYKTHLGLTECPSDINTTAIEVYLRDNKIMQIKSDVFSNLSLCNTLNLRDNSIFWIEEGAFRGLDALIRLNLKNNLIRQVNPNVWEGLQSLNYLELSGNSIDALPDGCFSGLLNLLHLYLNGNKLIVISKRSFAKLSNLTTCIWEEISFTPCNQGVFLI